VNRLRAQKLLESVRRFGDFPIVAETWRELLEDHFDLPRLRALLDELRSGEIALHEAATRTPSPFARGVAWTAANYFMYDQYERPAASGPMSLADEVLREVLHDSALRPRLDSALVASFEASLQRTGPEDAPVDDAERADHVFERILVRPWGAPPPRGLAAVPWGGGWIVAEDHRPRIDRARAGDDFALGDLLRRSLEGYGPRAADAIAADWEVSADRVRAALAPLVEDGRVIVDRLTERAMVHQY
jgi:ATP-dependent Lhr-like helicase